jgi:hypothetical protein
MVTIPCRDRKKGKWGMNRQTTPGPRTNHAKTSMNKTQPLRVPPSTASRTATPRNPVSAITDPALADSARQSVARRRMRDEVGLAWHGCCVVIGYNHGGLDPMELPTVPCCVTSIQFAATISCPTCSILFVLTRSLLRHSKIRVPSETMIAPEQVRSVLTLPVLAVSASHIPLLRPHRMILREDRRGRDRGSMTRWLG